MAQPDGGAETWDLLLSEDSLADNLDWLDFFGSSVQSAAGTRTPVADTWDWFTDAAVGDTLDFFDYAGAVRGQATQTQSTTAAGASSVGRNEPEDLERLVRDKWDSIEKAQAEDLVRAPKAKKNQKQKTAINLVYTAQAAILNIAKAQSLPDLPDVLFDAAADAFLFAKQRKADDLTILLMLAEC